MTREKASRFHVVSKQYIVDQLETQQSLAIHWQSFFVLRGSLSAVLRSFSWTDYGDKSRDNTGLEMQ